MRADGSRLLALRRRSVALCLALFGTLSLVITYVVPVAQALATAGGTISPFLPLGAPVLEFPGLKIPAVTTARPAPQGAGALALDPGAFGVARILLGNFESQVRSAAGHGIDPGYALLLLAWSADLRARLP
jgi:hypothetical protein